MKYDLIIIGMGISGASAAIYAKNSNLNVLLIEKEVPGGLLNKISTINNYPGFSSVSGSSLAMNLFTSINNLKIPYKIATVTKISVEDNIKKIETSVGTFFSDFVLLATGRKNRKLGLPNEEKLLGHGISTCALCDGHLYKDKEIAVVGGGNTALDDALYLANIAKKVYLIHRRDMFRGEEGLVEKVRKKENIEILLDSIVTNIIEKDNCLEEIIINGNIHLKVSCLFTLIGFEPNYDFIKNLGIVNEEGYIEVNENQETKIKGIYASGDCVKKEVYQLVTAASEGVIAAINISKNK